MLLGCTVEMMNQSFSVQSQGILPYQHEDIVPGDLLHLSQLKLTVFDIQNNETGLT